MRPIKQFQESFEARVAASRCRIAVWRIQMKRGPAFFFVLGCLLTAGAQNNADFDDLSRRAEAALDTHPEEATVLYRKALAIRPDWAEGWLYMGASLFQTRHYAEARDALRKGVALETGMGT